MNFRLFNRDRLTRYSPKAGELCLLCNDELSKSFVSKVSCGHVFHHECIKKQDIKCPQCQTFINNKNDLTCKFLIHQNFIELMQIMNNAVKPSVETKIKIFPNIGGSKTWIYCLNNWRINFLTEPMECVKSVCLDTFLFVKESPNTFVLSSITNIDLNFTPYCPKMLTIEFEEGGGKVLNFSMNVDIMYDAFVVSNKKNEHQDDKWISIKTSRHNEYNEHKVTYYLKGDGMVHVLNRTYMEDDNGEMWHPDSKGKKIYDDGGKTWRQFLEEYWDSHPESIFNPTIPFLLNAI